MTRRISACASAALALAAVALTAPAADAAGRDAAAPQRADWSAGPVARGTGYIRPGGSRRVREVQRTLRRLGYGPGPVDGLFGPRTERATLRFQGRAGLVADGIVGRRTLRALRALDARRRAARAERVRADRPPSAPARPAPPSAAPVAPAPAVAADAAGPSRTLIALLALVAGALVAGIARWARDRTAHAGGDAMAADDVVAAWPSRAGALRARAQRDARFTRAPAARRLPAGREERL